MRKPYVRSDQRSWLNLFMHHGGWLAIFMAVLVLVLTVWSVRQVQRDALLATQSTAMAEVLGKSQSGVQEDRTFQITYRYTVPEGTFTGRAQVGLFKYLPAEVGDIDRIYYLRADPKQFSTTEIRDSFDAGRIQFIAAVFGVVGLFAGARSGMIANSAVRARRYGAYVQARVSHIEVIHAIKWYGDWFDLWRETDKGRLVFVDDLGRVCRSMPNDRHYRLGKWTPGTMINVYRGPKRSWWEVDVGARANVPRSMPIVESS